MKQMEVTILGQSYILGCPDGGEMALLEAVDLDALIRRIDTALGEDGQLI